MKRVFVPIFLSLFLYGCAGTPSGGFDDVVIDSEPPGALVIVNGTERGRTPLGLDLASNQNHTLVFRHADYPDKSLELHRHLIPATVSIQVMFGALAPRARIGSDIAPRQDLIVVYGDAGKGDARFSRGPSLPAVQESPAPEPVVEPKKEPMVDPEPEPEPEAQAEPVIEDTETAPGTQEVVKEEKPKPPRVERCVRCRRDAVSGSKYCEVHGG